MGGCALSLDELSHYNAIENKTVILVGRSGSGKSATANSIIEDHVFDKMPNTTTIRHGATFLANGQILTVIDTPGAFDISVEPEIIGLKTGIHAVLFVVSLRTLFSVEESLVIESLTRFFGAKLGDYMIVVFTHGDALEGIPLEYYFGHGYPEQLKRILEMCGDRFVVFDNVTEDKLGESYQREELLRLVDEVVENNDGIPYTKELFVELKEGQSDQHTEVESSDISENGLKPNKTYEDQLLEMESSHREMTQMLEKKLKDEQFARMQAEAAQMKSNDEIGKVREDLKRAIVEARKLRKIQRETKELLKKKTRKDEENQKLNNCAYYFMMSEIEHKIESQAKKFGRMQAEENAERKSNDEIRKLREDMERVQRYTEDSFKKVELRMCDENLKKIEHQIESRLNRRLENQLTEKLGRMQAEDEVERKSNDEIRKMRVDSERIRRETHDIFNKMMRDQENRKKNEHQEGQWEIMSDQHAEVEFSEISENGSKSNKAYEDQLREMEWKHRQMTRRLEKQLANEHAARTKAEADAQSAQMKSNEVISKLAEDLKRAQGEARKLKEKKDDEIVKKIELAIENQIESKLSQGFENLLVEKSVRLQAEEREAQRKSKDEIRKLREDLERYLIYTDTFKKNHLEMGDEEKNQKKYNYAQIYEATPIAERNKQNTERELEELLLEIHENILTQSSERVESYV